MEWRYIDKKGRVQGPFGAPQMQEWFQCGFLPNDLKVQPDPSCPFAGIADYFPNCSEDDVFRVPPKMPRSVQRDDVRDDQTPTPRGAAEDPRSVQLQRQGYPGPPTESPLGPVGPPAYPEKGAVVTPAQLLFKGKMHMKGQQMAAAVAAGAGMQAHIMMKGAAMGGVSPGVAIPVEGMAPNGNHGTAGTQWGGGFFPAGGAPAPIGGPGGAPPPPPVSHSPHDPRLDSRAMAQLQQKLGAPPGGPAMGVEDARAAAGGKSGPVARAPPGEQLELVLQPQQPRAPVPMVKGMNGIVVQPSEIVPGSGQAREVDQATPREEEEHEQVEDSAPAPPSLPATSAVQQVTRNFRPKQRVQDIFSKDDVIFDPRDGGSAEGGGREAFAFRTNDGKKFKYGNMTIDPGSESEDEDVLFAGALSSSGLSEEEGAVGGGTSEEDVLTGNGPVPGAVSAGVQPGNGYHLPQAAPVSGWESRDGPTTADRAARPAVEEAYPYLEPPTPAGGAAGTSTQDHYSGYSYKPRTPALLVDEGETPAGSVTRRAGGAAHGAGGAVWNDDGSFAYGTMWEYASGTNGKVFGPFTSTQMRGFDLPASISVRRCGDRFFKRHSDWPELLSRAVGSPSGRRGERRETNATKLAAGAVMTREEALFIRHFFACAAEQTGSCPTAGGAPGAAGGAPTSTATPAGPGYLGGLPAEDLDGFSPPPRCVSANSKSPVGGRHGDGRPRSVSPAPAGSYVGAADRRGAGAPPLPPLPTDSGYVTAGSSGAGSPEFSSVMQPPLPDMPPLAPLAKDDSGVFHISSMTTSKKPLSKTGSAMSNNSNNNAPSAPAAGSSAFSPPISPPPLFRGLKDGGGLQVVETEIASAGAADENENLTIVQREKYERHMQGYYSSLLKNPDIGFFAGCVRIEEGGEPVYWEERWINPLLIHFSQREIHPFFHARGPVEEVIPAIWSEEVQSSFGLGAGRSTSIFTWESAVFGGNGPVPLLQRNQQIQYDWEHENRNAHYNLAITDDALPNTAHLLYTPFPCIRVFLLKKDREGRHPDGASASGTGSARGAPEDHFVGEEEDLHDISSVKLVTIDNRRLYALQRAALKYWPNRCMVKVLVAPIDSLSEKRLKKEEAKFTHGADKKQYDGGRWANVSSGRTMVNVSSAGGGGAASGGETSFFSGGETSAAEQGANTSAPAGTSAVGTQGAQQGSTTNANPNQQTQTTITSWETFDWILEVKKKESVQFFRNLVFPDVANRELTTDQRAFSLQPFLAIALFKHFEQCVLGFTQNKLLYRLNKDRASVVEFLEYNNVLTKDGLAITAAANANLATSGAGDHGGAGAARAGDQQGVAGGPATSAGTPANPSKYKSFGQAFAGLSDYYYENWESRFEYETCSARLQQVKAPAPGKGTKNRDPSRLLDFFGERWLERRHHHIHHYSGSDVNAWKIYDRTSCWSHHKIASAKQENRWKKEAKADWSLWTDVTDMAYKASKEVAKGELHQTTFSDSCTLQMHPQEQRLTGMEHSDLDALVDTGFFDELLLEINEAVEQEASASAHGAPADEWTPALEDEWHLHPAFLDAALGVGDGAQTSQASSDSPVDPPQTPRSKKNGVATPANRNGSKYPSVDIMAPNQSHFLAAGVSPSSRRDVGRSPRSAKRYWQPVCDVHADLNRIGELFKVKQFLDVYVQRKWTVLHVRVLLQLVLVFLLATGNGGDSDHIGTGAASSSERSAAAEGADETTAAPGTGDENELVPVDYNLLFGLHLRDQLYSQKNNLRRRLPELGVQFTKASKATLTARGVQLSSVGSVENLPNLVAAGSPFGATKTANMLASLVLPQAAMQLVPHLLVEEGGEAVKVNGNGMANSTGRGDPEVASTSVVSALLAMFAFFGPMAIQKGVAREMRKPIMED
eukprot:g4275.t1